MNRHFVQRNACPACASRHTTTLCSVPYTESPIRDYLNWYYAPVGKGVEFEYLEGSSYTLDECGDCGLIYQKEIPDSQLMARLYEIWLDPEILRDMERNERGTNFYFWITTEIARVLEFLARPTGTVAFLDFGMGWGSWCLLAKGFGCDAYGTELSAVRNDNAKQSGINVLSRDQLSGRRFDFINAEQVFEHVANPLETLVELAAVLNPGGVVRIGVPRGWDIKRCLRAWDWNAPDGSLNSLNAVAPLQHINCYNFRSLAAMGQQAGLKEIELPQHVVRAATSKDALKSAFKMVLRPIYRRFFPRISNARRQMTGTIYLQRPA